jgi:hypothetical protein
MMKKKKEPTRMIARTLTVTQPQAWVEAWKKHMQASKRVNLSAFIAEAVNGLIAYECKKFGRVNPVEGTRGEKGRRPISSE